MMIPAPTPALEMPQPQFLLQLLVIAFDDPALLGQQDQVLDFRGDGASLFAGELGAKPGAT